MHLIYEDGESSEQLAVANPADDSEAEFQPNDKEENFINKDLEARIVVVLVDETNRYSFCPSRGSWRGHYADHYCQYRCPREPENTKMIKLYGVCIQLRRK